MKSNRWTVALAAVFAIVAVDAFAQLGSIRGKLVDPDGNPVEGVECAIEISGGGRRTKATSKDDGQFVRPGLRPNMYTIECEKEGYRKLVLQTQVQGFEQSDLGEHVMYPLAEGELSESEHARATELLAEFNKSAEAGDDAATLESLMELVEMMPKSPEVNFNIASTYERMENQEKALEYYEKTTELKPDFYDAWVAIGDLHGKRKEWSEAAAASRKAIDLKATDPILLFNYGVFAQNAGDMEGAELGYRKALEVDPTRSLAHYQLGLIAVAEQENEEALAHFEKFLELSPDHPQAAAAQGVIDALKQQSETPQ